MDREAVKEIKKFLKKLKKDFLIDKVIFFGSRTRDDYLKNSDIDLIIISKDFEGIDFERRIRKMYDYWDFNFAVDFFCYTPKEFEKLSKMITLAKEAKEKGILLK